jgi:gas vesicle protein
VGKKSLLKLKKIVRIVLIVLFLVVMEQIVIGVFKEKTEANKLLRKFPTDIPGAAEVKKFEFPDAKYCLVHIKQIHEVEGLAKKELKEVQEVQNDIYLILSFLIDNWALNEVYNEAVWNAELSNSIIILNKRIDDLLKDVLSSREEIIKEHIKHLEDEKTYRENLKKEIKELKIKLLMIQFLIKREREKRVCGPAVERLCAEGRLKIKAAETLMGNLFSEVLLKLQKEEMEFPEEILKYIFKKAILDIREKILLELIASSEENPLPVVVYGGAHNWLNDIMKWNRKRGHQDEKFSLIIITPKAYKKYSKE